MDYRQTLEYLYEKLPMFQRMGSAAIKKDLTNTIAFCAHLGHPEHNFKSIHIAGTNGKGSVSHFLASILQEAGYKTGLYTSPHLIDFRERIRVNGEMISEEEVVNFVEEQKVNISNIAPSFFELTVAMAFNHFSKKNVDVAIIETGLGGRLDSTNVIKPQLSIITNISYDHQNMLGNTLAEIAFEKAGIIKEKTPVVVGSWHKETAGVFKEVAKEKKASLSFVRNRIKLLEKKNTERGLVLDYLLLKDKQKIEVTSPLAGDYQVENLATVIYSVVELRKMGYEISDDVLKRGILKVKKNTGFKGRWEVLGKDPLIVVDVAHNEAGLRFVLDQIHKLKYKKLHFIYGMVNDKDINKALNRLPKEAHFYFCKPDIPRGLDVQELKKKASEIGLNGNTFSSVAEAFNAAKKQADAEDLILVAGSIFVAAEVLGMKN